MLIHLSMFKDIFFLVVLLLHCNPFLVFPPPTAFWFPFRPSFFFTPFTFISLSIYISFFSFTLFHVFSFFHFHYFICLTGQASGEGSHDGELERDSDFESASTTSHSFWILPFPSSQAFTFLFELIDDLLEERVYIQLEYTYLPYPEGGWQGKSFFFIFEFCLSLLLRLSTSFRFFSFTSHLLVICFSSHIPGRSRQHQLCRDPTAECCLHPQPEWCGE